MPTKMANMFATQAFCMPLGTFVQTTKNDDGRLAHFEGMANLTWTVVILAFLTIFIHVEHLTQECLHYNHHWEGILYLVFLSLQCIVYVGM